MWLVHSAGQQKLTQPLNQLHSGKNQVKKEESSLEGQSQKTHVNTGFCKTVAEPQLCVESDCPPRRHLVLLSKVYFANTLVKLWRKVTTLHLYREWAAALPSSEPPLSSHRAAQLSLDSEKDVNTHLLHFWSFVVF